MSENLETTPAEQPVPGSDEYNQQMVDRFENKGTLEDDQELVPEHEMPEGGQEKYFNKETGEYDWQSHAKELQFNADGRPKDENKTEKTPDQIKIETKSEASEATEEEQVNDIITAAGLTGDELTQKIMTDGDLSAEDYAALQKVGIPEAMARTYVENFIYRRDGERAAVMDYVGGEEAWNEMSSWAADNMSEGEINSLNEQLANGQHRLAMDSIKSRMGPEALQNEPQFIAGEQRTGGVTGYRSKSEMVADMSQPRYQTDASFRQDVMRKMQSATFDLDNYSES